MFIKKSLSLAVAAILTMPAGYAISAENADGSRSQLTTTSNAPTGSTTQTGPVKSPGTVGNTVTGAAAGGLTTTTAVVVAAAAVGLGAIVNQVTSGNSGKKEETITTDSPTSASTSSTASSASSTSTATTGT